MRRVNSSEPSAYSECPVLDAKRGQQIRHTEHLQLAIAHANSEPLSILAINR